MLQFLNGILPTSDIFAPFLGDTEGTTVVKSPETTETKLRGDAERLQRQPEFDQFLRDLINTDQSLETFAQKLRAAITEDSYYSVVWKHVPNDQKEIFIEDTCRWYSTVKREAMQPQKVSWAKTRKNLTEKARAKALSNAP